MTENLLSTPTELEQMGETLAASGGPTAAAATVLEVHELEQKFFLARGFFQSLRREDGKIRWDDKVVHALNKISFDVKQGEVFALVGESGCGKSTAAKTVIRLLEPAGGQIIYQGQDISHLPENKLGKVRREMQMIFQDPYTSLNPRQRVIDIICEPLLFHKLAANREEAEEKAVALLQKVGLRPEHSRRYPHQFSGGQRQRIVIARSLAVEPSFIIADEPVSALDVSIQAQILNLLMDLKDEMGFSCLFIAHDLSVVRHISDRLACMYLGSIVEKGSKDQIFEKPLHPYTKMLFSAVPTIDEEPIVEEMPIKGEIPSAVNLPQGCYFYDRCPYAMPICQQEFPTEREIEPGHLVACHLYDA